MPKQKKSAFIYFCEEERQTNPVFKGKTLPQVIEQCGTVWEQMDSAEREPYSITARDYSEIGYCASSPCIAYSTEKELTGKFDSFGRSLKEIKQKETRAKYYEALVEEECRRKSHNPAALANTRLHVISAHLWYETKEGTTFPAELGLTEFTIKDGITHRWHQLFKPFHIPLGYRSEVMRQSEKTHQIDPYKEDLPICFEEAFQQIVKILTIRGDEMHAGQGVRIEGFEDLTEPDELVSAKTNKLLPLYALQTEKPVVTKFLRWFSQNFNENLLFPVYDISKLLTEINNNFPKNLPPMLPHIVQSLLSSDMCLYAKKFSCKYHEDIESPKCASGRSTRQAMLFMDMACQIYQIPAVKHRHVAYKIKTIAKSKNEDDFVYMCPDDTEYRFEVALNGPGSFELDTDDRTNHPLHSTVTFGVDYFEIDQNRLLRSELNSVDFAAHLPHQ